MPFTDEPWSTPESDLDAAAFCSCCLIDMNESGQDKVKANCKLPVKSRPDGPFNRNAIRNAMGRLFQMSGVPSDEKAKAARRLVRLAAEADIEVTSDALKKLAGVRR